MSAPENTKTPNGELKAEKDFHAKIEFGDWKGNNDVVSDDFATLAAAKEWARSVCPTLICPQVTVTHKAQTVWQAAGAAIDIEYDEPDGGFPPIFAGALDDASGFIN